VRVLATRRGRHEEQHATARTRFRFQYVDERTTYAFTAVRFVHDEGADLRSRPFVLDRRRGMELSEAYDLVVELRDHDPITDDDEALEPWGNGSSVRLVTQLSEQDRDRRGILRPGIPNRQTHAE
jgi:hypothetical protein